jgi:hypothetical protein
MYCDSGQRCDRNDRFGQNWVNAAFVGPLLVSQAASTLTRTAVPLSLVGIKEPGLFGVVAPVLGAKTGHLRMVQA